MDLKLLLRIFVRNIFLYNAVVLVLSGFMSKELGSSEILFNSFFAFMMSLPEYYNQMHAGYALGINKGDENYLKVNFSETLPNHKEEAQIIKEIQDSDLHLGKVYYNDKCIKRQKFKGVMALSVTRIETKIENGESYLEISTNPWVPFTRLDNYHNHKAFNKLKDIIAKK